MIAASLSWLEACGLDDRGYRNWWVELKIETESGTPSRLELHLCPYEWGFSFEHDSKRSLFWFSDRRDEVRRDRHGISGEVTEPAQLGALLATLERRYGFAFQRYGAEVRSNLPDVARLVRQWLVVV
jgi:hypothetical protein